MELNERNQTNKKELNGRKFNGMERNGKDRNDSHDYIFKSENCYFVSLVHCTICSF